MSHSSQPATSLVALRILSELICPGSQDTENPICRERCNQEEDDGAISKVVHR